MDAMGLVDFHGPIRWIPGTSQEVGTSQRARSPSSLGAPYHLVVVCSGAWKPAPEDPGEKMFETNSSKNHGGGFYWVSYQQSTSLVSFCWRFMFRIFCTTSSKQFESCFRKKTFVYLSVAFSQKSTLKGYPPGNESISHQRGKPKNHHLQKCQLVRICDRSQEGIYSRWKKCSLKSNYCKHPT